MLFSHPPPLSPLVMINQRMLLLKKKSFILHLQNIVSCKCCMFMTEHSSLFHIPGGGNAKQKNLLGNGAYIIFPDSTGCEQVILAYIVLKTN